MNWDTILNYELLRIGDFKLMSGNVMLAVLQLIGTWFVVFLLRKIITRAPLTATLAQKSKRYTIFIITKYIIWTASIIVTLETMNVRVTFLLAGATALLVTIGLGLQHIFRDLFSGLFLLFEETVKVGDIIEVNGEVGEVIEMNLRSSEILTRDKIKIIIPNSKFIEEKVVNWTHSEGSVRFVIEVGVSYDSDVDHVVRICKEVMAGRKEILNTPVPFVVCKDFAESSILFELSFWSNEALAIELVKSDLRMALFRKFKDENICIPFPQRDFNIKGMERLVNVKNLNN